MRGRKESQRDKKMRSKQRRRRKESQREKKMRSKEMEREVK